MKRKLLYASVAALLAVAILVTMLTGCFGLYGPTARLLKAGKNTLAQESFTILVTATQNGKTTSTMTYQVCIDFENRDLTIVGANQKQQLRFAIYKGTVLYRSLFGVYSVDIRPTVEKLFDAYENTDDFSIEEFLRDLGEDVYNQISSKADIDELEKSMLKVYFDANSPLWLKKNAGWSRTRSSGVTLYRFSPDWDTLSTAVMEEFEDAFYDPSDYDTAVQQIQAELEDWREQMLSFCVGVKGNKIVSFSYTAETDEGTKTVTAELTRFGTTQIETAPLEDLLSSAHLLDP